MYYTIHDKLIDITIIIRQTTLHKDALQGFVLHGYVK